MTMGIAWSLSLQWCATGITRGVNGEFVQQRVVSFCAGDVKTVEHITN